MVHVAGGELEYNTMVTIHNHNNFPTFFTHTLLPKHTTAHFRFPSSRHTKKVRFHAPRWSRRTCQLNLQLPLSTFQNLSLRRHRSSNPANRSSIHQKSFTIVLECRLWFIEGARGRSKLKQGSNLALVA